MVYKFIVLLLIIFKALDLNGQTICHCTNPASIFNNTDSTAQLSCDTIYFKNHSVLYTQYDCDSAWISFKTPAGKRVTLYAADNTDSMFEMDWKFAPVFIQEYKSVILFGRQQASAMDYPLSFSLLNKTTGAWEKELGELIYYSQKTLPGFVLYFPDSLENTISVYVADKRKGFNITLPKGRSLASDEINPGNEFETPVINGTAVTIRYKFVNARDSKHLKWGILKFDLAEYVR